MTRKDGRSAKRFAAGVCCLAVATAAFAVLVTHLIPESPTVSSREPAQQSIVGSYAPLLDPQRIEDVQFGSELSCDEVLQGKRFVTLGEELASLTDDERMQRTEAESWEVSYEGLSLSIARAEVLDGTEFLSIYPGYCESNPLYEYDWEFKAVIVEVSAANRSAQAIVMPSLLLWGRGLRGATDITNNGLSADKYALAELIGCRDSQSNRIQPALPNDWNVLQAGESRTVMWVYTVPISLFEHANDYENLDERDLCLSLSGYDPAVVYRLWLG